MAGRGLFFIIQVAGTMLSRVSGLARLVVEGALMGGGATRDTYVVAQLIPNVLRSLFAEEAIKAAFLPALKQRQVNSRPAEVLNFQRAFLGWLLVVLTAITVVAWLLTPGVLGLQYPWASAESQAIMSRLSRIGLLFLAFIGVSGYLMTIFYSRESALGHWVTALCPIAFNGGVIACGLLGLWFPSHLLEFFILGTVVGALGQLLVQLPFLWKEEGWRAMRQIVPRFERGNSSLREVRRQWWPAVLGAGMMQINVTFDRTIGFSLATGAVTALQNAARIFQLPVGTIGVSTAVSLHATLSADHERRDHDQFAANLAWGVETILFAGLPLTALFLAAAEPICSVLYQYGRYEAQDVLRASLALQTYAIGIPAFCLIQLFRTAYSALQDVKVRSMIDMVSIATNIAFSLSLLWLFGKLGWQQFPALAMGTSLSSWLQLLMYAGMLRSPSRLGTSAKPPAGVRRELLKIVVASAAMGAAGVGLAWLLPPIPAIEDPLRRVGMFVPLIAGMGLTYLGMAAALRMSKFDRTLARLRHGKRNDGDARGLKR